MRAGRPGRREVGPASGTVERCAVKDAGELALLRLACETADAALAALVAGGGLRPGGPSVRSPAN